MLKYLSVSPSINYQEKWYLESLIWNIDEELQRPVASDTIRGFNRVYDYSVSTGINTRLYGTYFFKSGRIKAIRHVMNPGMSFSYRPDFSDPKYGFYQHLVNEEGRRYIQSVHQGFVYGGAPLGESGSIGLSINNTLEMKVQKKDSIEMEKVSILNNFGVSTSYNILADSFKLSNISLRANTSLFNNKVNLSLTGVLDPYEYRTDSIGSPARNSDVPRYYQTRIDRMAFQNGGNPGTLSSLNFALSTNLNPKANTKEQNINQKVLDSNLPEEEKQMIINNAAEYVDFSIPWSLRINYSLSFMKDGLAPREVSGHNITFSGNISLTEKWKATFTSGYNIKQEAISLTTIGVIRDLHCWTMDFNWTPFGRYTNYNFTIRVKSTLLQDLKLDRRRSFFDNAN